MIAAFRLVASKEYGSRKGVERDACLNLPHFHVLGEQGQELSFDIEAHPHPPGVASQAAEGNPHFDLGLIRRAWRVMMLCRARTRPVCITLSDRKALWTKGRAFPGQGRRMGKRVL